MALVRGRRRGPKRTLAERFLRALANLTEAWRTSLQVRVIGSIFIATSVVMAVLGVAMMSVVTQRLAATTVDNASAEIDRARAIVEQQVANGSGSTQVRLNAARVAVANRSNRFGDSDAVYEPVLVATDAQENVIVAPEGFRIPDELRRFVSEGQVAYQFTPVDRADGTRYRALIVGTPSDSDISNLQVYLVVSVESEAETIALMRGLIVAGMLVVVVLIVGIAWFFAQQVLTPVRSASRIAERLAGGHLRERMVVEGEDEMARLAMSFNSMAGSLDKQITQLREYGNLQRQFTSDVSHELRTPLTTVRMAADMLEACSSSFDARARRATELLGRELDRFEELLADLLEISRHDAGVADLAEAELSLDHCVRGAYAQVTALADEVGAEFTLEGPSEGVSFVGDPRRVERILRNLFANAADHSEGNPVLIRWAGDSDAVAVTVIDHGVGLKEGQEELVFNRFWRADSSRVRHSGGTGLGLAIALEDAVLHGGALEAIGTFGVGSCFRLTLPRTPGGDWEESPLPLEPPPPEVKPEDSPGGAGGIEDAAQACENHGDNPPQPGEGRAQ